MLIISGLTVSGAHDPEEDKQTLDDLIVRTGKGDREAFAELYGRTRAAVYAMALSYLKNAEDAEDAAQDTFVKVLTSSGAYVPKGTPMAWILTITRNLSLMRMRRRMREGELSPEEWDAIPEDAPRVTSEDRLVLGEAMRSMTDEERRIVLLHASSGLKHRETAKLLELPLSTVLSKYNRAIKKLQSVLKGELV